MDEPAARSLVVAVVGPCGAGKSTLIAGLARRGIPARHVAQEHSYVPGMWRHMVNPDVLIYLGASYSTCTRRRQLNWLEADYSEQLRRLADAREHANLIIETDDVTVEAVLEQALLFLKEGRARPPLRARS